MLSPASSMLQAKRSSSSGRGRLKADDVKPRRGAFPFHKAREGVSRVGKDEAFAVFGVFKRDLGLVEFQEITAFLRADGGFLYRVARFPLALGVGRSRLAERDIRYDPCALVQHRVSNVYVIKERVIFEGEALVRQGVLYRYARRSHERRDLTAQNEIFDSEIGVAHDSLHDDLLVRKLGAHDLGGDVMKRAVRLEALSSADVIKTAGVDHAALKATGKGKLTLFKPVFRNEGEVFARVIHLHHVTRLADIQQKAKLAVVAVNNLDAVFFSLGQGIATKTRHLHKI